jgi:hypothetical protein
MVTMVRRDSKGKGRIRGLVHRGSRSDKAPAVVKKVRGFRDPTVCERCGAVYSRKTWRTRETVDAELFSRAAWAICPACRQEERGVAFGRVLVRGAFAATNEDEIRRRIQNVADRAGFTQPERRLVDVRWAGDALEVLTTSQKLAHRIVSELKKAFHGRSSYAWSDRDGRLFATWERD